MQDNQWQALFQDLVQPSGASIPTSNSLLTSAAADTMYQDALHQTATTAKTSVTAGAKRKRDNVMQELAVFLASLPKEWGKTMGSCTPRDVLVFMITHCIPQHAGSVLESGLHVMAPSSLANAISGLSTGFKEMGKGDIRNEVNKTGNPARSHDIQTWRLGYSNILSKQGYRPRGGKELVQSKVKTMLQHLYSIVQSSPDAMQRSLAARDGAQE